MQTFIAKYPNPTDADRVNWVTNEQDMNIKRLGVAPYTILEIIGTYVNAQEMDTTSIDMYATYDLDLDGLGSLRLGLDATQVQEFSYTLVNGVSGEAVGEQNGPLTDIPPLPELQLSRISELEIFGQPVDASQSSMEGRSEWFLFMGIPERDQHDRSTYLYRFDLQSEFEWSCWG